MKRDWRWEFKLRLGCLTWSLLFHPLHWLWINRNWGGNRRFFEYTATIFTLSAIDRLWVNCITACVSLFLLRNACLPRKHFHCKPLNIVTWYYHACNLIILDSHPHSLRRRRYWRILPPWLYFFQVCSTAVFCSMVIAISAPIFLSRQKDLFLLRTGCGHFRLTFLKIDFLGHSHGG